MDSLHTVLPFVSFILQFLVYFNEKHIKHRAQRWVFKQAEVAGLSIGISLGVSAS